MTDNPSGLTLPSLILALGFLVVLLGVLFAYMWFLQCRYFTTCKEQNNLILFSQSPAGAACRHYPLGISPPDRHRGALACHHQRFQWEVRS